MDRMWVRDKENECLGEIMDAAGRILEGVEGCPIYSDGAKAVVREYVNGLGNREGISEDAVMDVLRPALLPEGADAEWGWKVMELRQMAEGLRPLISRYRRYGSYADSEPAPFHGDIIITDPCYLTKKWGQDTGGTVTSCEPPLNDWEKCGYGENMGALGITDYICRDTIFGDWDCSVYLKDEYGEEEDSAFGAFSADAGLVIVADLGQVRAYNPGIDRWLEGHSRCAAVIKDFHGTVQFAVKERSFTWDDTTKYHKKGDVGTYYAVEVVGSGSVGGTSATGFVGRQN